MDLKGERELVWEVEYEDGSIISEREKPWDEIRKDGIKRLKLLHEKSGKHVVLDAKAIKGMQKQKRALDAKATKEKREKRIAQFFQFKRSIVTIPASRAGMEWVEPTVEAQIIGIVLNKKGDCLIMQEDKRTGLIKGLKTNIFDKSSPCYGLNLELFGIDLSKEAEE